MKKRFGELDMRAARKPFLQLEWLAFAELRPDYLEPPADLEKDVIHRANLLAVVGRRFRQKHCLPCADRDDRGFPRHARRMHLRAFYAELVATGREFDFGDQRPAVISGDLALTSTRLPDGDVPAEVARRQDDGTWLWVIDQFSIA
jgi:hypothetical protein